MKITFVLISILINFFNLSSIQSEEKIDSSTLTQKNNIHIVKEGDTISNISKFYSVDKNLILKFNDLKNENYIFIGQNLIIPNANKNSIEETNYKTQKVDQIHIVQLGENLTEISNKYKLNVKKLIEINNIKNPDAIEVGDKILLSTYKSTISESTSPKKINNTNKLINLENKNYGPLTIQSEKLEKINGRYILKVSNQNDKKLILSLRCETNQIDVRIPGRKWQGWKPAKDDFEKNLINDLC